MTYKQLKAGLNARLQTKYPILSNDPKVRTYHYYGLEVVEGYVTPCFFTRIETGESRPANKETQYNRLVYTIMYIPQEIDEIDILEKVDTIRGLFNLSCPIAVGDDTRYVHCIGFDWGYGGTERDVLEISVDLEYLTDIREPETADIMHDATVKYEWRE